MKTFSADILRISGKEGQSVHSRRVFSQSMFVHRNSFRIPRRLECLHFQVCSVATITCGKLRNGSSLEFGYAYHLVIKRGNGKVDWEKL